MNRRTILKSMAAGGLVSIAAIRTVPGRIDELDALHVVRGENEVVRTVENPTGEDLKQMEEQLEPDESVRTGDGGCATYCLEDCNDVCEDYPFEYCDYACSCDLECSYCCG